MKEKQACRGHGRPKRFRRFAAGGLLLIGMGIKILLEHTVL